MPTEPVTVWLSEHRVDGCVVARVGRRSGQLVAELANLGTFAVSELAQDTHFEPASGANARVLEKLSGTLLAALLRHAQGKVTLHAGAVCMGDSAVAFAGPSGSGKSTLAAALCADGRFSLVSDDTVAIEVPEDDKGRVEIAPTQNAAWLLPDARLALGFDAGHPLKVAVPLRSPEAPRLSLCALLGLVFDPGASAPSLRRLRGQDALAVISSSVIRFVIDDPAAHLREFEQLGKVVEQCPVFELRRPKELRLLDASIDLVRALVLGSGSLEAP
jgi:hypothetical protein